MTCVRTASEALLHWIETPFSLAAAVSSTRATCRVHTATLGAQGTRLPVSLPAVTLLFVLTVSLYLTGIVIDFGESR